MSAPRRPLPPRPMPPDPALKRREEELLAARVESSRAPAVDTGEPESAVTSKSLADSTMQNARNSARPVANVPPSQRGERTDTMPADMPRNQTNPPPLPPRMSAPPLPSLASMGAAALGGAGTLGLGTSAIGARPSVLPAREGHAQANATSAQNVAPRPAIGAGPASVRMPVPRPNTASEGRETMPPAAFPSERAPIVQIAAAPQPAEPAHTGGRTSTMHTLTQMVEHIPIPRLRIFVESDGGVAAGTSLFHDGDECRVGTHPSNDLVLKDRAVSRFHCRIVRDGNAWRVIDSSSRNGTRLDGVRIRDAELGTSGELSVGDSVVRLSSADAAHAVDVPMAPAFGSLAGVSLAMRKLFALLERVAESDINVLIQGESGTGKEVVATEIMRRGPRANKPFVIVDCGAISPSLIESELFGHIRGAFTGADRDRIGAFEAANTGTVFLDEIGELPLELQPKLLRALEAKEVRRVGETKPRKIDVRVISATNRELDREVNKGRFREDLYFRLAVIAVRVPALRERLDDILILIRVFLNALGVPHEEKLFSPDVITNLARHDWPGNVRELRNYVERTVVLRTPFHEIETRPSSRDGSQRIGGTMGAGFGGAGFGGGSANATGNHPAQGAAGAAGTSGLGDQEPRQPFRTAKEAAIDLFERGYLTHLMEEAQGNMSKAARLAAMDRMYLHKLVQKHGLRAGGNSALGSSGLSNSGLDDF